VRVGATSFAQNFIAILVGMLSLPDALLGSRDSRSFTRDCNVWHCRVWDAITSRNIGSVLRSEHRYLFKRLAFSFELLAVLPSTVRELLVLANILSILNIAQYFQKFL